MDIADWVDDYAQGRDRQIPDLTDRMKLVIDLAAQNVATQAGGPFAAANQPKPIDPRWPAEQNGRKQLLFAALRRGALVLTVAPERRETDHEERRQQARAAE
jgi:hypothetical protein